MQGGTLSRRVIDRERCKAVERASANGMNAYGYLIVGSPGETVEDARMTLDFARNYLGDNWQVSLLTPLPGTPAWDEALAKGLVDPNMDWGALNANYRWNIDDAILINDAMTRDELRMIRREFVNAKRVEGAKRKFLQAMEHPRMIKEWIRRPRRTVREVREFLRAGA